MKSDGEHERDDRDDHVADEARRLDQALIGAPPFDLGQGREAVGDGGGDPVMRTSVVNALAPLEPR